MDLDRHHAVLMVSVRFSGRVSGLIRDREFDLEQELRPGASRNALQMVLAVLAHETTVAEAARRHGVSAELSNRWRNRFLDAGKAALEDGKPGKAGSRGSLIE